MGSSIFKDKFEEDYDSIFGSVFNFKKPEEPKEKSGFVKVEPPFEAKLKFTTFIFRSPEAKIPITTISPENPFVVTWRSDSGWLFGTSGHNTGYIKIEDLESPLPNVNLKEVKVQPQKFDVEVPETPRPGIDLKEVEVVSSKFDGDLNLVAEKIHEALNSSTSWILGSGGTKLKEAIPINLSNEQKAELENLYKTLYGKTLTEALYQSTKPSLIESGNDLFNALVKTTVSQKEWGALSIRSQAGNKLALGATVNYTFEGPRPQKIELLGSQGIYKDWVESPRLFTPRVLYWLVSKPGGDVDSDRMKDATEYTFNFEADKQGVYTVMAIILTESEEKLVLRDYINIVSSEQIANESFEKNEGLSKDHFNKLQTSLLINKMRLQNPVKENLGSVIVSNRNPAYFHESDNTSETYQVNFQLKNPQKNESYLWYVTADDKSVLNNSENYYFSLSHVNKTNVADMPDGNRAFSTMQLFEPELNKAQIALYFPMAKKLPDSIKYKVVCERYQNGKLTGVENFIQYYNDKNSRQEQQREEQLNETQSLLKGMEEARRKIDGPVLPINAMYVNEAQGISNAISVFYGKSKKQDKNKPTAYIIVDLTRNVETTYYEGETLVDALQNFSDWQSYPDGLIKLKAEGINYVIKTKGGSVLHYISSRAGLYSMLSFAGGVLTFFVPGAQGVSAFLMTSAFTLGFAAAGLGLVDSLAKDKLNGKEITLDVLQLATSLMGLRATKLKALSEAKGITTLTGTAKYLYYSVAVGDGVQGLIISKDAADEINTILLDKKLNDNEKLIKLSQVLVGFLATMAIIVVSTAETQTLKTNLQNKGVPNSLIKSLAKEPGELMLLDNLAKEEIEVALKEGKDLVKVAKEKVERRRELERKKRIEDTFKRHFWRKNVDSKEYWLSPNEMREKVMAWAKDYRGKLQTKGQLHRFNKASIASYRNEKGEIEIVFGRNGGVLETGKKFNTISAEKNLPLHDELSNRLPDKTDWPNKANCAECDAVNQALHNGAKWEDIQIHTINIDKNGNMSDFYRCDECLGIFNDMYVTSE